MKKLLIFSFACLAAFAGYGCGPKNIKMDSREAVELVHATLEKNVDWESYKLISAEWKEAEKLSDKLGALDIELVNIGGGVYTQTFDLARGGKPVTPEPEFTNDSRAYFFQDIHSLSLEDFNTETILDIIRIAREKAPENTKFRSLNYYKLIVLPESGEKGNILSALYIDKDIDPATVSPATGYEEIIMMK